MPSNDSDLQALYPFLHGKQQDPAALDAALLHSVEEKARESRETNARFFGEQAANSGRRGQGARRRLSTRRPHVHHGQWRLELRRVAYRRRVPASDHRRPSRARGDQPGRRSSR